MARRVVLTRTPQKAPNQGVQEHVSAVGQEMASHVFVFTREPLNPLTQQARDVFSRVASPQDLVSLPEEAPLPGSTGFRKYAFTAVHATREEAESQWETIQAEVNALIRALNLADQQTAPQVVVLEG